ncbi:DHHA1 domain-containing protein, partial [Arenicella sp.]|nr:DHHA1 domain-containing protein [Arenicella sp.]
VDPYKLRFDFSHDAPMTAQQIIEIEDLVNQQIFSSQEVTDEVMPIADAKAAGAEALFGEKYGDQVRVISMSDFSLELCGGTHVSNTSEIGLFKIINESGVAAGIRRLEALTRRNALTWANQQYATLKRLSTSLKTDPSSLEKRLVQLQESLKTLEDEKKKLQKMIASGAGGQDLESKIVKIGDVQLLAAVLDGADKDLLRSTIDKFKDKHPDGIIVLGAKVDGKVKLTAGVAKSIANSYPAGKLIQHITSLANGRGGGRADMAEGGIPDAAQLQTCLDAAQEWVEQQKSK